MRVAAAQRTGELHYPLAPAIAVAWISRRTLGDAAVAAASWTGAAGRDNGAGRRAFRPCMDDLTRERIAAASPFPPPPVPGLRGLTFPDEARLRAEMLVFLHGYPAGQGLWLFTYGALMGKPEVASPDIVAPGRLAGYGRSYCLYDVTDRGTFEAPGATLGLEAAGVTPDSRWGPGCAGVLLHLAGPDPRNRLWPAWKQEMGAAFYVPVWVDAALHPSGAPVRALTFVANRTHRLYAGRLPVREVAARVAAARGPNGAASEYLLDASEALHRHGLRDAGLEMMKAEVARVLGAGAAASGREPVRTPAFAGEVAAASPPGPAVAPANRSRVRVGPAA